MNREKLFLSLKLVFIFFVIYLYHFIVKEFPGDDTYFKEMSNQYTLFDYLDFRYHQWTGRMTAEAALYIFLDGKVWLWRILNPLFIMLLAFTLCRLIKEKVTFNLFFMILFVIGYFSQSILSSGVLWITGSMVYLWPITLGLVSMIPFSDFVLRNRRQVNLREFFLSFITGGLAVLANEQVALCMLCFGFLAIIFYVYKYKYFNLKLTLLLIPFLILTIFSVMAPGNDKRFISETATWFPGFDTLSLRDHLYIGVTWIFSKLFTELKWLILLLSVIAVITFYFKSVESSPKYSGKIVLLFSLFISFVLATILNGNLNYILFDFEAIKKFDLGYNILHIWKIDPHFLVAITPYLFWSLFTGMLCFILILVSNNRKLVILCLLASIASMSVMFFSPTIYASGNRTLTVSAVLLGLIITNLIIDLNFKNRRYFFILFCSLPLINIFALFLNWAINGYVPIL